MYALGIVLLLAIPCSAQAVATPNPPEVRLNDGSVTTFWLECVLQQADVTSEHDVLWRADGVNFARQVLTAGQTVARLNEDDMHINDKSIIGKHVTCEVSARKGNSFTTFVQNNGEGYYLGFQLVDAAGTEIEKVVFNDNQFVTGYIRLTIPVRCNNKAYTSLPSFLRGPECVTYLMPGPLADSHAFVDQLFNFCPQNKKDEIIREFRRLYSDQNLCRYHFSTTNWKNHLEHKVVIAKAGSSNRRVSDARSILLKGSNTFQKVWARDTTDPKVQVFENTESSAVIPSLSRECGCFAFQRNAAQVVCAFGQICDQQELFDVMVGGI